MLMNRIRQLAPIAILAITFLVTSPRSAAQEVCGLSNELFKSSFEAGEIPSVVLPPSGTPIALAVTSPTEGSIVGTRTIQVIGTWAGPANTGITVNGKLVLADFTNFASIPVQLVAGTNAITVKLTTQDGQIQTVTRNVTYDAQQAPDVSVSSTGAGDQAPFTTSFVLTTRAGLGLTITRIQADYNGDGQTDLDTTNLATPIKFTYVAPGTFTASVVVTLSDATTRTVTKRVVVLNPNQIRYTLCGVFGDMRARLVAQNISSALNTLHPQLRPQFESFWTGLGASLPTIAASLGKVADGTFSTRAADLLVVELVEGQPTELDGFHLLFERDADGVWRISAM